MNDFFSHLKSLNIRLKVHFLRLLKGIRSGAREEEAYDQISSLAESLEQANKEHLEEKYIKTLKKVVPLMPPGKESVNSLISRA